VTVSYPDGVSMYEVVYEIPFEVYEYEGGRYETG
jgi:hypothetical protein